MSAYFKVGDWVQKATGDYQAEGEIRGIFTTSRGHVRYAIEIWPQGFLHIYSDSQLRDGIKPASMRIREEREAGEREREQDGQTERARREGDGT